MNIWTVVRTVLEKNPSIKAKDLIRKVREKTDLSRSTIYGDLFSYEQRGMIYREKGHYWLHKPGSVKRETPEQAEISPEAANALVYYRILEKELGCSSAGHIADILEDLTRKYRPRK
jgi:DNA-binding transcriptional ArsR family regulator